MPILLIIPAQAADNHLMLRQDVRSNAKCMAMAIEPQENRRAWQTPKLTWLFAESSEGGAIPGADEAGHAAIPIGTIPASGFAPQGTIS